MVSKDLKMGAKKVGSPFLQCLDNGKKFFLMNRVVFLSIVELVEIIRNRAGCFPSCTKAQYSTGMAVAGISSDIDV